MEKAREKKLLEAPVDTTASAKVAQASSFIDLVWKYKWAISNVDIDVAKELGLVGTRHRTD